MYFNSINIEEKSGSHQAERFWKSLHRLHNDCKAWIILKLIVNCLGKKNIYLNLNI